MANEADDDINIDRATLMIWWNAAAVFCALLYLGLGFFKTAIVALFLLISCGLGYGARWLFPIGFATSFLGIAVLVGLPHPSDWPALMTSAARTFDQIHVMLRSLIS